MFKSRIKIELVQHKNIILKQIINIIMIIIINPLKCNHSEINFEFSLSRNFFLDWQV